MANFIQLTKQNLDTSMQKKRNKNNISMTRFDITVSIKVMLAKLHSVLQHSHTQLGPVVVSPLDGLMALQNLKVGKWHRIHNTWHCTPRKNSDKEKPQIPLLPSSDLTVTRAWIGGCSRAGRSWKQWTNFAQIDLTNFTSRFIQRDGYLKSCQTHYRNALFSSRLEGEYIKSATIHLEL